jgi:RNA polymerase sigma-70 factor (ECF subfamily)
MEQRTTDEASDQSLMLAVREGDVEKLGILFERHHGQLFNFLLRLTGNRHLSEDLVQEVFVRLLKYRHTYRGKSQFTTWMFQIARNARIDHFRRSPREEVGMEDEIREHVSLLPTPSEQAEHEEETRIMLDALARLPEEKREVLLLRGFQGLKFEEIAEILKCSVNTIKGRTFRAIRDLQVAVHQLESEGVL